MVFCLLVKNIFSNVKKCFDSQWNQSILKSSPNIIAETAVPLYLASSLLIKRAKLINSGAGCLGLMSNSRVTSPESRTASNCSFVVGSFLAEDGLVRFEELVKKVQGSDAYLASVKFYPDAQGKVHGIYHLAQGVKTILPKEPFVPVPYTEQLAGKELIWEIDLVKISGDGSKAEDYEAIARLDYAKFLESLPEVLYQQLDANQLEIQPILGQDFEGLATIE